MAKTVLVFGTFDPLHAGHDDFFRQAKALGDYLLVVVARDGVIRQQKQREAFQTEAVRLAAVSAATAVDEAMLGDAQPQAYDTIRQRSFDVLAVGYDQAPTDDVIRTMLTAVGKESVPIVRLQAYKPEQYKSSYLRPGPA